MIDIKHKDRRDLWGGLIVIALGIVTSLHAWSYPIGSASHMGPGFFPMVLGVLLMVFGSLIIATAQDPPPTIQKICFRIVGMVTAAMVSFSVLLAASGLIPAIMASTLLSGLAGRDHDWRLSVKIGLSLSLLSAVIFKYILGMQVHLF